MAGWETGGGGVRGEIGQPDRTWLGDQQTEDALAVRRMPDLECDVVVDTAVHELLHNPVRPEHSQRGVPGVDEVSCRVDDVAEHHGQLDVGGHQVAGPQEGPQSFGAGGVGKPERVGRGGRRIRFPAVLGHVSLLRDDRVNRLS